MPSDVSGAPGARALPPAMDGGDGSVPYDGVSYDGGTDDGGSDDGGDDGPDGTSSGDDRGDAPALSAPVYTPPIRVEAERPPVVDVQPAIEPGPAPSGTPEEQ